MKDRLNDHRRILLELSPVAALFFFPFGFLMAYKAKRLSKIMCLVGTFLLFVISWMLFSSELGYEGIEVYSLINCLAFLFLIDESLYFQSDEEQEKTSKKAKLLVLLFKATHTFTVVALILALSYSKQVGSIYEMDFYKFGNYVFNYPFLILILLAWMVFFSFEVSKNRIY